MVPLSLLSCKLSCSDFFQIVPLQITLLTPSRSLIGRHNQGLLTILDAHLLLVATDPPSCPQALGLREVSHFSSPLDLLLHHGGRLVF